MDPTNRNTAIASAMVEELARCGVTHAALSPGSRSTPLAVALWREPGIEVSVHIDERCAGFWALGASLATGRPVPVLCTSGSAAANLHPAVVEADEAGVALIVLTADRPPELRDIGAGQTIDQVKLYGGAVRWFCELGVQSADDAGLLHARSTACRAFGAAAGDPRPGPVHVNVPLGEPLAGQPVPDDVTALSDLALDGRGNRPLTAVIRVPVAPTDGLVEALADRVAQAERGVIVCGRHPRPDLRESVPALADATGFPILAEPTSQLRCGPHDRSAVISSYDEIARDRPPDLAPDLVLRFGDMPTSKALRAWIAELAPPQIVVDETGGWNEPSRVAGAVARVNGALLARALAEVVSGARGAGWLEAWRAADDRVRRSVSAPEGLTESQVAHTLCESASDGEIVFAASSMPVRDVESFCPSTAADILFLSNRGANGIDGTVSSAIGAAAASGRPATLLIGDLALVHDMGGLRALATTGPPVRIVCVDNGGGGIFKRLPQADLLSPEEFEALFKTPSGLDVERIASLFAVPYAAPNTAAELGDSLSSGSHVLVHVRT